jgi:hypothetical protein
MRLDWTHRIWSRLLRPGRGSPAAPQARPATFVVAPRARGVRWGRGLAALGLLVLALVVMLLWAALLALITLGAGRKRMPRERLPGRNAHRFGKTAAAE